ncbi:hypothetical protein E3N88_23454 [Mikania micrantha]|uniref:Integrase catalytic domain-containing protein n=1 Tax=Mikania micrantha TaxID=192012 RepID=A0A5N6NEX4_9ASTR|nr:hypothetical protein E3N88_23454 [Mikania micrantha]
MTPQWWIARGAGNCLDGSTDRGAVNCLRWKYRLVNILRLNKYDSTMVDRQSWDDYLPLTEFSYNNSYHSSIGMPPYEMLYGRKCRTRVCWGEVGQRELAHKNVVKATNERINQIRAHLKAAQDRQKSYADKRRRPIEFQVGDFVLLKVSPWKGVIRFRKQGKLSHVLSNHSEL